MSVSSIQNASPDVCKILVGNKLDCEDERIIDTHRGKSVSVNLIFFSVRLKEKKAKQIEDNKKHYYGLSLA